MIRILKVKRLNTGILRKYRESCTLEVQSSGFKSDLIGDIEQFMNIFLVQKCCEHTGYGLVLNS